jgi:uncharacterized membrane protein
MTLASSRENNDPESRFTLEEVLKVVGVPFQESSFLVVCPPNQPAKAMAPWILALKPCLAGAGGTVLALMRGGAAAVVPATHKLGTQRAVVNKRVAIIKAGRKGERMALFLQ